MKKLYFLLLVCSFCFGQEISNDSIIAKFSIDADKMISWKNVYKTENKEIISNLKQNPNIIFTTENIGYIQNMKLECLRDLSLYAKENFKANFRIDLKEGKYRITVNNIQFHSPMNIIFGGIVSSNVQFLTLESFELRTRDNELRKNWQSKNNLVCLSLILQYVFSESYPKQIDNSKW